ncbi:hypothetical protein J6590_052014 [Homalodisca vitripennis]|nr:hypothetical protein J6590_052014 [Homalodisca vitripennis]
MRLHLMQGIVLFHLKKKNEAKQQFERVQSELSGLKLDDDKLYVKLNMYLWQKKNEAKQQFERVQSELSGLKLDDDKLYVKLNMYLWQVMRLPCSCDYT